MLLKPRFGIRMWSGIWPPSKPKTETPERLFWPFWPRPPVLPRPEPMPRPTRTRPLRAPLLSRRSLSFMSLHSLSLLSRFPMTVHPRRRGPRRSCSLGSRLRGSTQRLLRHRHHVPPRPDHAAHLGGVVELDRLVQLVEPQADQRRALVPGAADRRSGLGHFDLGHDAYSTTASASAEASAWPEMPSRRAIRSAIFLPRRWATLFGA